MADYAHEQTDKILAQVEGRLRKEYRRVSKEIQKKLDEYLQKFEKKNKVKKQQFKDGKITWEEYRNWRTGQILIGERWRAMQKTLAEDMRNVNNIAKSVMYGYMPEVYALNHNYATFEVEKASLIDTSYTLYDRQTVERLMRENPQLLPNLTEGSKTAKLLAENKDLRWNKQRIQSELLQGILQGESIPQMAKRMQRVTDSNYKAAVRNARTMATGAQNAGRMDGYKRAEKMGINLSATWVAALDGRTRHSHRVLDGQTQPIGKPFEFDDEIMGHVSIRYPGDLGGEDYKVPPSLIWNCRCTIIAQLKGFETDVTDLNLRYNKNLGSMTYDEWKNAKGNEAIFRKSHNIKSDKRQFKKYKSLKIDGIPTNFEEFQKIKYDNPEKWEEVKKAAHKARQARKK